MNRIARALAVTLAIAAAGCSTHRAAARVPAEAREATAPAELVVLVHGMGRTPLSMWRMQRSLERAGFDVLNWGYSSTCCRVEELSERLRDDLAGRVGERQARVHFVAHSLGTVIVRVALSEGIGGAETGRIVLLAPPSRGARSADRATPWLGWLLRPLPDLRTTHASIASTTAWPADAEIAVIAGRFDAKVTPHEARVDNAGLLILAATHSFLMLRGDAVRSTVRFLRTGQLDPDAH